jgi:hypothetical protein
MPRKTRKAAKPQPQAKIDYTENQVAHLCGKHAFNMLLQEEKFVWLPNRALYINKTTQKALPSATTNPKDQAVQINLWSYCRIFGLKEIATRKNAYLEEEATKLHRQVATAPTLQDPYYTQLNAKYAKDFPQDLAYWTKNKALYGGKTVEEIKTRLAKSYTEDTLDDLADGGIGCTMTGASRGDLPFALFRELFTMLGYTYEESAEHDWAKKTRPHFKTRAFLGLLINQGTWHYVAAPRYTTRKTCKATKYTFANSTENPIISCHTKRELTKLINNLPPTRMFSVFAPPDAYESVAVQRLKAGTRKPRLPPLK